MVLYATSTSLAELNYLALPTWTRLRSRFRFSHSVFLWSTRPGSLWCQCFCASVVLLLCGRSVACLFTNSPFDSCFHASRLLSACTVGHTARLTPVPPRLSVARFLRSLSTTVFALSYRPAEMLVAFWCSITAFSFDDYYRLLLRDRRKCSERFSLHAIGFAF